MSTFSTRLKMLLDEKGLMQKDLAKRCDTSAMSISRYINGSREPTMYAITALAKALNVSSDYLLGLSDVENPKPDLTAEQRVLLAALSRASERDEKLVYSILEAYVSPAERSFLDSIGSNMNNIA